MGQKYYWSSTKDRHSLLSIRYYDQRIVNFIPNLCHFCQLICLWQWDIDIIYCFSLSLLTYCLITLIRSIYKMLDHHQDRCCHLLWWQMSRSIVKLSIEHCYLTGLLIFYCYLSLFYCQLDLTYCLVNKLFIPIYI